MLRQIRYDKSKEKICLVSLLHLTSYSDFSIRGENGPNLLILTL